MKILLVLVHSTQNAGDLALLSISIKLLKRYFPNAGFIISSNYPDERRYRQEGYPVVASPLALVGKSYGYPAFLQVIRFALGCIYAILFKTNLRIIPHKWEALFEAYENSDIVIAVPGNQIFSTGKLGWPFPATMLSLALAHYFKKPLFILPQSIGPLRRWWERQLFRLVYSRAQLIYLREKNSLELAHSLGIPHNKTSYAPDPAFILEAEPKEDAQRLLKAYGWDPNKPALGITVIAPMGKSLDSKLIRNYYRTLEEVLPQFASAHQLQIVFFCQVTGPTALEDDRIPSRVVYNGVRSKHVNTILIEEPLPPSMLKACYGEMQIFLASRLHSGIFSLGMKVPTLFIGYLPKTSGVLKSIGLEKYGLDLMNLSPEALLEILEQTWKEKEEIASALPGILATLSSQVPIPFQKISSATKILNKCES